MDDKSYLNIPILSTIRLYSGLTEQLEFELTILGSVIEVIYPLLRYTLHLRPAILSTVFEVPALQDGRPRPVVQSPMHCAYRNSNECNP